MQKHKLRILIAPLDWGLGHATRCIPIIKELLAQQTEVWIAADGAQELLLKAEFPDLRFLSLPGYNIRYSKSGWGLFWKMLWQAPGILKSIYAENKWLQKNVGEYKFNAVISDNRYGLFHETIPGIFITHQLFIKTPFGKQSGELLQKWNYQFINRFTQCWVPDEEGENNLAGDLSHPLKKTAIPLKYLGFISRLKESTSPDAKKHLLILISGPEPQRTRFEKKILSDLVNYKDPVIVIRGLPAATTTPANFNAVRVFNHLPAEELNKVMDEATFIISRCGYSTVMDIARIHKKSILIPTPGQTEQKYLAGYLMKSHFAVSIAEKEFSLQAALQQAAGFTYKFTLPGKNERLKEVVQEFLSSIR